MSHYQFSAQRTDGPDTDDVWYTVRMGYGFMPGHYYLMVWAEIPGKDSAEVFRNTQMTPESVEAELARLNLPVWDGMAEVLELDRRFELEVGDKLPSCVPAKPSDFHPHNRYTMTCDHTGYSMTGTFRQVLWWAQKTGEDRFMNRLAVR